MRSSYKSLLHVTCILCYVAVGTGQIRAQNAGGAPGEPATRVIDPAKVNWTTVTVSDPMFNMPAYIVRIPSGWTFAGAVLRGPCGGAMLVYRAESPDGLTGVHIMPRAHWTFAQDARAFQFSGEPCNFHPPVSATKQAPEIAAAARPQPQIGPVEPVVVPGFAEMIAKNNQAYENQARAYGRAGAGVHESGDAARVRIRYNYQGHAEEEWINVSVTINESGVAVSGRAANGIMQPGMVRVQYTETFVNGMRAPLGRLDASMPLLKAILTKIVPEYDQAVLAFNNQQFQQVQAIGRKMFEGTMRQGQLAQEALVAQHTSYMQWQQRSYAAQRQQFQADMIRKDAQNKNFVDYVSDRQYYMNPETGATVTVQNVHGTNGVITQSLSGGWVQLAPVSH